MPTSAPTPDTLFAGAIPPLYHRYLGPLLFAPYAREVARRLRLAPAADILETAAGTGLVTRAVAEALPDARIVATDLNPAMLALAARQLSSPRVTFEQADAMVLPFEDGRFDLVICQFGAMFYPDRVRAHEEARRVLADGGRYLLVVWDAIDANPVSDLASRAVARLFPRSTPSFFARVPFGYSDREAIARDLRAAGFADVAIDTVRLDSDAVSARDAATGLVAGTPLRSEIEAHGADALPRAVAAAAAALAPLEVGGRLASTLSAHVVTATR